MTSSTSLRSSPRPADHRNDSTSQIDDRNLSTISQLPQKVHICAWSHCYLFHISTTTLTTLIATPLYPTPSIFTVRLPIFPSSTSPSYFGLALPTVATPTIFSAIRVSISRSLFLYFSSTTLLFRLDPHDNPYDDIYDFPVRLRLHLGRLSMITFTTLPLHVPHVHNDFSPSPNLLPL